MAQISVRSTPSASQTSLALLYCQAAPRCTAKALRKVSDFRDHLPENCPPEDAVPADGVFYRLIAKESLDARAFLSKHELLEKPAVPCSACEWGGVSLQRKQSEAEYLSKKGRGRLRGAQVARGVLTPQHGVTKQTPRSPSSTHTTYWPFADAEPWLVFEIVSIENG